MRGAAERADIATLKNMNSVGWGIIALLFAGIITGIFQLLANGPINDLTQ
jgi:putative membrane protein